MKSEPHFTVTENTCSKLFKFLSVQLCITMRCCIYCGYIFIQLDIFTETLCSWDHDSLVWTKSCLYGNPSLYIPKTSHRSKTRLSGDFALPQICTKSLTYVKNLPDAQRFRVPSSSLQPLWFIQIHVFGTLQAPEERLKTRAQGKLLLSHSPVCLLEF